MARRADDLVAEMHARRIDAHPLDLLWQRRIEERGRGGSDKTPEFGDERRRPVFSSRINRFDGYSQAVAGLRARDGEWTALRIQEGMLQFLGGLVRLRSDLAAECVLGVDDKSIARLQSHDRFNVGAIHEGVRPLLSVGASMLASGFSGRNTALGHD